MAGKLCGIADQIEQYLAKPNSVGVQNAYALIGADDQLIALLRRQGLNRGSYLVKETLEQKWLADHLQVRGRLMLDAGAVKALREQRKSLLPVGVYAVSGEFERGEVVGCCNEQGTEIARGLVNYSVTETRRILKTPSSEIEARLGYVDEAELIHRDNLILL